MTHKQSEHPKGVSCTECEDITLTSPTQVCPECKKTHCKHYESDFERYCKENPIEDPIFEGVAMMEDVQKVDKPMQNPEKEDWEKLKKYYSPSAVMAIDSLLARAVEEERQFVLNVLDGVDIADEQMGNKGGGTKAIRHALASRVI